MIPRKDDLSVIAEFMPAESHQWMMRIAAVLCLLFMALPLYAMTIPECRTTFGYTSAVVGSLLGTIGIASAWSVARAIRAMRVVVRSDGIVFKGAFPGTTRTIPLHEICGVSRGDDNEIIVLLPKIGNYAPDGEFFAGQNARDEFERLVNELVSSQKSALENT